MEVPSAAAGRRGRCRFAARLNASGPMVLTALDVNDPQPRRDDVRFNGDYVCFRKADKAWNERERTRRKKARGEAPAEQQAEQRAPAAKAGISAAVIAATHFRSRALN